MTDIAVMKEKFNSLTQLIDEIQLDMIEFGQTHGECRDRIASMSQALARASGFIDQSRIELEIISEEIA